MEQFVLGLANQRKVAPTLNSIYHIQYSKINRHN